MASRPTFSARRYLAVGGAAFALYLAAVLPTGAISAGDCQSQAGVAAVQSVAINQGNTITWVRPAQTDTSKAQATVEVFSRRQSGVANLGDIPDSQVAITIATRGSPSAAALGRTQSSRSRAPRPRAAYGLR
jgi:hypothetical protein